MDNRVAESLDPGIQDPTTFIGRCMECHMTTNLFLFLQFPRGGGGAAWNLARTLPRHMFKKKCFTPKYSVNYDFFLPRRKHIFPICYPNKLLYNLYTHVSQFFIEKKKIRQKLLQIALRKELTTKKKCSELYFTPGRSNFTRTMSTCP